MTITLWQCFGQVNKNFGNPPRPSGVEDVVKLLALALALPALAAGGVPVLEPEVPRAVHTATLLASGDVLVAGGCTLDGCEQGAESATTELFSARTSRFRAGPPLLRPRVGHGAARLPDGSVLVFGGWSGTATTATAERWHPGSKRFVAAQPLRTARGGFTVTALRDGRVLVTGGSNRSGTLRSAELYLPKLGRWVPTGSMRAARDAHTATPLPDGRVLVAGGSADRRVLFSAEIWSPRTGRFTPVAPLRQARHKHAAVAVRGGVLVLGGSDERDFAGRRSSAELYRSVTGRWERVGPLAAPRFKLGDAVVALPGGGALVAGGAARAERYDGRTRRFRPVAGTGRTLSFATATRLRDGRVLVVGGYDDRIAVAHAAWLLDP